MCSLLWANRDSSQHLDIIALLLDLIASIVHICKSLWIKTSAKWLNVNNKYSFTIEKCLYYCSTQLTLQNADSWCLCVCVSTVDHFFMYRL